MEYWSNQLIKIPKLGFGTYSLKGLVCEEATSEALNQGLRHIDTAQIYNNELEVGLALQKSKVPREEIFLTTKIWRDSLERKQLKESFEGSLKRLRQNYVDLLLIHWPNPEIPLKESMQTFEELKESGKIKHIGVSNFPCKLLQEAKSLCPALISNQVEYHPFLSQKKLLELSETLGIFLTAYSPLMCGEIFKIQQIKDLGLKYNKSHAQIALKWLIGQKNVIAIFRSGKAQHIEKNMDIFDFELEAKDKAMLFALSKNKRRMIDPPFAPKWDD